MVCIDNAAYPALLELHKIYRVLADDSAAAAGDLRVVDESGEDYLYPAAWFAAGVGVEEQVPPQKPPGRSKRSRCKAREE